jgi:hypothetical protein
MVETNNINNNWDTNRTRRVREEPQSNLWYQEKIVTVSSLQHCRDRFTHYLQSKYKVENLSFLYDKVNDQLLVEDSNKLTSELVQFNLSHPSTNTSNTLEKINKEAEEAMKNMFTINFTSTEDNKEATAATSTATESKDNDDNEDDIEDVEEEDSDHEANAKEDDEDDEKNIADGINKIQRMNVKDNNEDDVLYITNADMLNPDIKT